MGKRLDKGQMRIIADNINRCADDLIQVYPYVEVSDEGHRYGNKQTNIKDTIIMLKYCNYLITRELMEALDD